MTGPRIIKAPRDPRKHEYRDPHIDGCTPDIVFTDEHYYLCKPYQNTMYHFRHRPTGITWQAEAMHALQPMWRNLVMHQDQEKLWHMEEVTHALLHGNIIRARELAFPLNLKITLA